MIKTLDQLVEAAKGKAAKTVAVAQAADEDVLLSVDGAVKLGLANFFLVGIPENIKKIADKLGISWVNDSIIVPANSDAEAAKTAVQMVREGKADTLMKGLLQTGTFLKAVLNKEEGLRAGGLLCQCGQYENPLNGRLLFLTDCAMNIAPDLMQKKQIIENAVWLAKKLGIENPKVAVLAALETVNPDMPETVDASLLTTMAKRGQIKGCVVDGPLAMDNALSAEAAKHKGIVSDVAGDADIILVPDVKTGNAVHKTISYFTPIKNSAICLGAKVPIIMTSRTDHIETKVYSIALGCYVS